MPFGPISLRYYEQWTSLQQPEAKLGKIRWNKDETFCVAIDGQHRLAAIKKFAHNSEVSAKADVSVLLILLSDKLGFRGPENTSQVDILRSLFIDLNKHAKLVSRTRLILLDDRDPTSLCTRAMIGESLSNSFCDLGGSQPQLPLTLVDWHTDGAKVDKGPYLVSVLTLDWAVQKILGTSPIKDPMQYSTVSTQLSAFSKKLEIDLHKAQERLEYCRRQERPFAYSDGEPNELSEIANSFRKVWVPSITKLFSQLSPYDRLVDARKSSGSHVADFTNWYQLYFRKSRDKFGGHASGDYNNLIRRWSDSGVYYESDLEDWLHEAESKKEVVGHNASSLAFTVVFQKALVYALIDFLLLSELVVEDHTERLEIEIDGPLEDSRDAAGLRNLRYAALFVELVNRAIERVPDFLWLFGEPEGVIIWEGTLLSADSSTIDFTEAAAVRGQDVILMAVYLQIILETHVPGSLSDLVELISDGENGFKSTSDSASPLSRLSRACKSFTQGTRQSGQSASKRILKARQKDEADPKKWRPLVEERLRLLFDLMSR